MMTGKPFWESKRFWGFVFTMGAMVAEYVGYLPEGALSQLVQSGGVLFTLYAGAVAEQPLTIGLGK